MNDKRYLSDLFSKSLGRKRLFTTTTSKQNSKDVAPESSNTPLPADPGTYGSSSYGPKDDSNRTTTKNSKVTP